MHKDGINVTDTTVRSFLMIGQSNMAGRGEFADVEPIVNPLCYMLRNGRWQKMSEPINPDRAIFDYKFHSGVSLGASFADQAAKFFNAKVGMIPCADGGTKIDQWMPGELLYDHMLMMTRLAMRTSILSGIIWHQGESDAMADDTVVAHKDKFIKMITSLRRDLGNESLPVIVGEISNDTGEDWNIGKRSLILNKQYHEIAEEIPACAVVSAEGLTLKPDGVHFDAPSLRVFGRRYFEAYKKLL